MDITTKELINLQKKIEEVKNDNDPDPILYEKIRSYENKDSRRHINLPSILSDTKKTITDLVLRNYCFGEDFSISNFTRPKMKKQSFKKKHTTKIKDKSIIRNTLTNGSKITVNSQQKKKVRMLKRKTKF